MAGPTATQEIRRVARPTSGAGAARWRTTGTQSWASSGGTAVQIRLEVCGDITQDTIQPEVEEKTNAATTLNIDESPDYNRVAMTTARCDTRQASTSRRTRATTFAKPIATPW